MACRLSPILAQWCLVPRVRLVGLGRGFSRGGRCGYAGAASLVGRNPHFERTLAASCCPTDGHAENQCSEEQAAPATTWESVRRRDDDARQPLQSAPTCHAEQDHDQEREPTRQHHWPRRLAHLLGRGRTWVRAWQTGVASGRECGRSVQGGVGQGTSGGVARLGLPLLVPAMLSGLPLWLVGPVLAALVLSLCHRLLGCRLLCSRLIRRWQLGRQLFGWWVFGRWPFGRRLLGRNFLGQQILGRRLLGARLLWR